MQRVLNFHFYENSALKHFGNVMFEKICCFGLNMYYKYLDCKGNIFVVSTMNVYIALHHQYDNFEFSDFNRLVVQF